MEKSEPKIKPIAKWRPQTHSIHDWNPTKNSTSFILLRKEHLFVTWGSGIIFHDRFYQTDDKWGKIVTRTSE